MKFQAGNTKITTIHRLMDMLAHAEVNQPALVPFIEQAIRAVAREA